MRACGGGCAAELPPPWPDTGERSWPREESGDGYLRAGGHSWSAMLLLLPLGTLLPLPVEGHPHPPHPTWASGSPRRGEE